MKKAAQLRPELFCGLRHRGVRLGLHELKQGLLLRLLPEGLAPSAGQRLHRATLLELQRPKANGAVGNLEALGELARGAFVGKVGVDDALAKVGGVGAGMTPLMFKPFRAVL